MMRFLVVILWMVGVTVYGNSFVENFLSVPTRMETLMEGDETTELLKRYKPKIYVHRESYLPMDFYMDYLPNTVVVEDRRMRKTVEENPGREELLQYSDSYDYYLDLKVSYKKYLKREVEVSPAIYGRAYRDDMGGESYIFLKYNLVFPYSGLPEDISRSKRFFSGILGNGKAWHQLDIHGAYHLVIREEDMVPVAIMINQHNHHKVHILGVDTHLPEDGRAEVAIAKYSNEPYLWNGRSERVRTAGNPRNIQYIFGREDRVPVDGGYDYIGDPEEMEYVDTKLIELEGTDPLYRSKMYLGARKRVLFFIDLWYLDGPPGMDYYSYPQLKNLGDLMSFWYIDRGDDGFFDLLEESGIGTETIEYQLKRMGDILKNIPR